MSLLAKLFIEDLAMLSDEQLESAKTEAQEMLERYAGTGFFYTRSGYEHSPEEELACSWMEEIEWEENRRENWVRDIFEPVFGEGKRV